jgi:hypothetical protein
VFEGLNGKKKLGQIALELFFNMEIFSQILVVLFGHMEHGYWEKIGKSAFIIFITLFDRK